LIKYKKACSHSTPIGVVWGVNYPPGFTWGYSHSTPIGVGFHRQNLLKHKSPILNRLQYT